MSERTQSSRSRREKPSPDLPATVAKVDAAEAGNTKSLKDDVDAEPALLWY
jgi:hypothetical protein